MDRPSWRTRPCCGGRGPSRRRRRCLRRSVAGELRRSAWIFRCPRSERTRLWRRTSLRRWEAHFVRIRTRWREIQCSLCRGAGLSFFPSFPLSRNVVRGAVFEYGNFCHRPRRRDHSRHRLRFPSSTIVGDRSYFYRSRPSCCHWIYIFPSPALGLPINDRIVRTATSDLKFRDDASRCFRTYWWSRVRVAAAIGRATVPRVSDIPPLYNKRLHDFRAPIVAQGPPCRSVKMARGPCWTICRRRFCL
mmetsp:Transcript_8942/g.19748  ORF Transcript_8942/g.19748 Transcript_8942/m.19748 type:complete len:247 (+) Transcript_8942:728-1468(+)